MATSETDLMGLGMPAGLARENVTVITNESTTIVEAEIFDWTSSEQEYPLKIDGSQCFAKYVTITALPNNSSALTAHGLPAGFTIIQMWGTIQDAALTSFHLLPQMETNLNTRGMQIVPDGTNIFFNSADNLTAFLNGRVYIIYTKP